jgi:transglutaminase-like putative cysteine protease
MTWPAARRARTAACLTVLLLGSVRAAGVPPAASSWTVGPPAPWIRELPLPATRSLRATGAASGRLYQLVDHQVRFGSVTTDYRRFAWTALSTVGVQNASEIQIRFDPAYQRLIIHHVRLLREGRDVFAFRPADVRVIQQETALDERIYSGELTAIVFLRDLRPGDTLDYAYSVEGSNPILRGQFDDELPLVYESPVRVVRHVVQAPLGRALHITPRNTTLGPRVETSGSWRVYTWEARDVAGADTDENEPGWFDPDPHVVVSTFGSWAEVADWARGLFEQPRGASPEIRRLARQFQAAAGGPAAAAAEATRFVQDEIRYLGIEMGPSSHQPHVPEQVLRQRFGDCKDKSLLLVALLRELGVDAVPALVDTIRRRGLDAVQPSPFAFDHAIVLAVVRGRQVWIDPTESDLGGGFEDRDPPDFERALVLRPGTTSLTVIPAPDTREPVEEVIETYSLGRPGAPARLDVVSTYRRSEADVMRRELATTSLTELAKGYLEDLAKDDPDIRALAAPVVSDDRARNVIIVSESYEIPTFWKNGRRMLSGWHVEDHLPNVSASGRSTPLAVPYPVHVRHTVDVRAQNSFRFAGSGELIDGDAFAFTSVLTVAGAEMRLTFDYRSLADGILPGKLAAHQQAMERVRDALSFVVTSDLNSPDAPAVGWTSGWMIVGGGTILAAGALLVIMGRLRAQRGRLS